ncbi:MAG TPA: 30S ribosomal protein S1 [Candidatus Limnocylindrales bacterium]|nr:30S ribosomal protein S1 [Candidatus Limnocylindrales bacterium]
MTEEQLGGPAPETEANASIDTPATENTAAATAVADEPATEASLNGATADAGHVGDAAPSADAADTTDAAPSADAANTTDAVDTTDAVNSSDGDGADGTITAPITGEEVRIDAAPAAEAPGPSEPDAARAEESPADDSAEAAGDAGAPATAGTKEPAVERPRPTGPEPTTMAELLAQEQTDIRSFKHGDVVEGNVVRIDKDEILVDIGAKSEGVVSNRELYGRNAETQPQLNIGDTVLVYVLQPESPEGHVVLSLRRAGLERKWRAMQEQFEAGVIIEAPVIDHNKGGLIVDCGIRGFVPISQIVDFPRRPQNDQPRDAAQEIAEKLQPYVGRKLRLKILEVNRKANRLILSEKVALYEERREKRDELFSSLQVGQKVTGTVRSIAPFGVFIDLGGIDGLVHKSELSWNKVNNPESGYRIGDEVEAEVIDINHERGRISLSIRRLQPDPWESTVADFKVGDIIDGTVTKLVNFGAFVRVRDGLEGLIHISELSHQRVAHPGDVVHEGQQLKLKIISLESERHRLGLSLKQAEEPPVARVSEPAAAGHERPARRGRGDRERAYSAADAVQEPEGGIDNTLAAAFAQVREQLAASEAASEPAETAVAGPEPAAAVTAPEAAAEAVTAPEAAAEAPVETAEAVADAPVEAEATADTQPAAIEDGVDVEPESAAAEPAAETQTADALVDGALDVGPDHSTDAISNASEPAPEAAEEAVAEAAEASTGNDVAGVEATPSDEEGATAG